MTNVFDYEATKARMFERVREVTRDHAAEQGLSDELLRAVLLAAPFLRYPSKDEWAEAAYRKARLDYLVALEYGGYHGYDGIRIEDEVDQILVLWHDEIAECAKGGE